MYKKNMKILITGFDPFGSEKINPAFEAVKLLSYKIAGAEIIKAELPTVFKKCGEILQGLIEKQNPDAVICVGQAGGRRSITVEKVAINFAEASIPDNMQQQPLSQTIIKGAPAAYFSTLPIKAMVQNIKSHGIAAEVSYTAGTFVCNDVMFRLLHMADTKYPQIRAGFIHVPFSDIQVKDKHNMPCMPVETIAKALEYAIEAVCKFERDIQITAGATH